MQLGRKQTPESTVDRLHVGGNKCQRHGNTCLSVSGGLTLRGHELKRSGKRWDAKDLRHEAGTSRTYNVFGVFCPSYPGIAQAPTMDLAHSQKFRLRR
ncbi:unnamed protein product [Protopolystoma xenopodis]|uniref:Uncharacterized protein n=1 Tax=Protopolystoma xenopodis TaxID=117903 RepID=A0A3S5CTP4_9PLAT|nr:unnamed protein product [Protopolystoma xenopodis]